MPDFRFRLPQYTQLTPTQRLALLSSKSTLVTGGPGSGKTVVSIFRLFRLLGANQRVRLFTYNRTLMAAIAGLARSEGYRTSSVITLHQWYYNNTQKFLPSSGEEIRRALGSWREANNAFEEIIVDEAQDIPRYVLENLNIITSSTSCGADKDQDIFNNHNQDAENQIFDILRAHHEIDRHLLSANYRNTREVYQFARAFVPDNPRPHRLGLDEFPAGDLPEVFDGLTQKKQLEKVIEVVRANYRNANIGIFVHKKDDVWLVHSTLRESGLAGSYYFSGMSRVNREAMEQQLGTPLVTTYASCKGLEFDIVILPFLDDLSESIRLGYTTRNNYYVAATRAKRQLFLFCNRLPSIIGEIDPKFYRSNDQDDLFDF